MRTLDLIKKTKKTKKKKRQKSTKPDKSMPEPPSVEKLKGDSMHMPHVLTLLNKYTISTRFAKKFLT